MEVKEKPDGRRSENPLQLCKPHQALEGQTPAQNSGLNTRGWNELLKLAIQDSKGVR